MATQWLELKVIRIWDDIYLMRKSQSTQRYILCQLNYIRYDIAKRNCRSDVLKYKGSFYSNMRVTAIEYGKGN